jgi:hypothetical protein
MRSDNRERLHQGTPAGSTARIQGCGAGPAVAGNSLCLFTYQTHEELKMNQQYYDAVTKMEKMGVDPEYIQGWQGGYLLNPEREEQRVTEAYSAGYEDGKERNTDNFSEWVK